MMKWMEFARSDNKNGQLVVHLKLAQNYMATEGLKSVFLADFK